MFKKLEFYFFSPEEFFNLGRQTKEYASAKNNYSTLVRRRQTA